MSKNGKAARLGSGGGDMRTHQRGNHTTAAGRGANPVRRFGPNVGQLVLLALAMAGRGAE